MQEGTSIGLMTVVSILGFGILFGIMLTFMPGMKEVALKFITNGVNTTPTPAA